MLKYHCTFGNISCLGFDNVKNHTRALRRGHSLSQHTQSLKNNIIAENDFLWNFDTFDRTNTLASCSLCSHAFCASHSRKFSRKKSVSQSTRNALKRIEMPKKKKKKIQLWPITRFARSAKPERRSAMKFYYNQSDLSSNTFTKFHQNSTHSYRDIGFNSRTDRETEPRSRGETDNQIWGHRKTVTISKITSALCCATCL